MQEILAQQRNAAKPVTGKAFVIGVIGVVAKLALVQILTNLAIMLTGLGLINVAFYLCAILLIVSFMRKTVAGSLYMLKENALYLQKTLGDSTTSVVEIPLERIVSIRPVLYGERLQSSCQRVTVIDEALVTPVRLRLAFGLSVLSARLSRLVAGSLALRPRGYAVVFEEEGRRHACVFLPDAPLCEALAKAVPWAYGADERPKAERVTLLAQALQRAFPELYPHVKPLVAPEKIEQAREEITRQKQARAVKRAKAPKKPEEQNSEEAVKTDEVQDGSL